MNTAELRDLLHANADGPRPVNPARTNQINRRIRRRKIRMAATAGLAAASVAVAITGVWAGLSGGSTTTPGPLTHGSTAPKESPSQDPGTPENKWVDKGARFTAEDGTVYRRVSVTSLGRGPGPTAARALVNTRGDKPLAALIQCNGKRVMFDLYLPNRKNADSPMTGRTCQVNPGTVELSSLKKDQRITVSMKANNTSVEGEKPADSALITTSIYEWTPPAKPSEAPKAPKLQQGSGQLLKSKSAVWPETEMLTLTVPYRGIPLYFAVQCAGAIGDQAVLESTLNSKPVKFEPNYCESASDGQAGSTVEVPTGAKQVTVTVRLADLDPAYRNRTSSWTIGLFERE